MEKVEIVRQVEDRLYKYGTDTKGGIWLFCKKCGKTMNLIDIAFTKRFKEMTYYCSTCHKKKLVKNKLF